MLRRFLPLLALLAVMPPAAAQQQQQQQQPQPEWRQSSEYDVLLRPYGFEPRVIRLEPGRPVRLRFVNSGQATLSFRAPAFFAAARLRQRDSGLQAGGAIRLAPGERRTIALVPAPGRYRVRSGNLLHRLRGMSGEIIVE
jgi:plastocyanin